MDTLCIPVCPELEASDEAKSLRFRAIKQITPIFIGAYNALVLDSALEGTTCSGSTPADLPGDAFASYIMGCTWMERGWTLQEGSLSHSCVMQLMGKPFEMSMALGRGIPAVGDPDSPFSRAALNIRRSMVIGLRRQLLEYKREIMMHPYPTAKILSRFMDAPVFVWAWNSLINRSMTCASDAVLIFASLLDFDVYQLRAVPQKERLMRVLQGCEQLPLSLLYNTGPRVCIEDHPELGWLPEDVKGDSLIADAVLRKLKSRGAHDPVSYRLEHSRYQPTGSLFIFLTKPGQKIPSEATNFQLVNYSNPVRRVFSRVHHKYPSNYVHA